MKYFKKHLLLTVAALTLISFSSCNDLSVENNNEPDQERALSSPADIETLIQGTFRTFYFSSEGYYPNIALSTAADELSSSWGNFGMRDISSEPRAPYDNDPSYSHNNVAETPYGNIYAAISTALDGLNAIENGIVINDEATTQRAKAFGQFVIGASHALMGTLFDQGFLVTEVPDESTSFELVPHETVFQGGLDFMQSAISTAQSAPDFTIPNGWMGSREFTKAEFIAVIKTYRAYYRSSMPRTPQERQNVDWQAVIDDIDGGFTEMNGGQTFKMVDTAQEKWFSGFRYYGKNDGWIRVDLRTIGPADVTNAYQNWLSANLSNRNPFDVTTNDRRITGDAGPQSDGKYIRYSGSAPFPESRGIYHYSSYTYSRNLTTYTGYQQGNSKWIFTGPTMRLLKAEALLQQDATGNKATVVSIINETRVDVGELSAATVADATGSMSDDQSALSDASVWAKLKHEKRMESMGTASGMAFFDKRGWGDLVSGTVLEIPIPGSELLILQQPIYTTTVVGGGTD
jgi:hypothetical protein